MPGRYCAIASCSNNQQALRKKGSKIIFHCFPKGNDMVSTKMRKEWVKRCKRANTFNTNTASVCSNHFTPDDYERDLQNELLGLPIRQVLKKTAVPKVNLGKKIDWQQVSEEKIDEERNGEIVNILLTSTSSGIQIDILEDPVNDSITKSCEVLAHTQNNIVYKNCTTMTETEEDFPIQSNEETPKTDYKKKYEKLLQKYSEFRKTSGKKIKSLNSMLKYYKNKYYNFKYNCQLY